MDRRVLLGAVVTLLVDGCVSTRRTVAPMVLEAHAGELRAGSHVVIGGDLTSDGRAADLDATSTVELVDVTGHKLEVRLRELVADCPPHAPDQPLLCKVPNIDEVVVYRHRRLASWVVPAGIGGAVVGGAVACIAECSATGRHAVEIGSAVVGGVVLVGAIVFAYEAAKYAGASR